MPNDESSIAYCGLCCLDCHGHTGKIPDLARDLRKELRTSKYDKFAHAISQQSFGKAYKEYDACYEVLGAMVKFRCKKGCRNGGGNPFCKIRICCQKKNLEGCWKCTESDQCKNLETLIPVHDDAHIKNLNIIKKKGKESFIKGKRNW